eukprot:CAMPEP_0197680464 /NCGR_PEP_ID=MMETSP1338-20131121/93375_1 /TAXON_ID=43686 ORGANISM="Pelagodinium beii, Strain RCC1491" /NCGR_SAMPLE_ID=MMETSP1338 /ASSEMBLY_ACC=CAM_ASM_000754 /LENGTH=36 /DNA_ID= /DNA_START= /DNA_END= /DNA_ORIENTATION=
MQAGSSCPRCDCHRAPGNGNSPEKNWTCLPMMVAPC